MMPVLNVWSCSLVFDQAAEAHFFSLLVLKFGIW